LLKFLYISLKTKKNIFTKNRRLVDIQTNGQTDIICYRHFCNFFQMLIKNKFSRQVFLKIPKYFWIICTSQRKIPSLRERERERGTINVAFRNFVKPLQMHCTSTGTLRIFCPSFRWWSQNHITLCQVNTASHMVNGWHMWSDFGKNQFKITYRKSIILYLLLPN
jgi:hypothetical protein